MAPVTCLLKTRRIKSSYAQTDREHNDKKEKKKRKDKKKKKNEWVKHKKAPFCREQTS